MYYFKSLTPSNKDGSVATYPPGWFGEMTYPPANSEVEVLLYHDGDKYVVARTASEKIVACAKRGECTIITETEANKLFSQAINQLTAGTDWKTIFFGDALIPKDSEYSMNLIKTRWSDGVKKLQENLNPATNVKVDSDAVFCPVCHQFITWLPDNIIAKSITLVCPAGHKVVTNPTQPIAKITPEIEVLDG